MKSFKMIEFLGKHYDLSLAVLIKKNQVGKISEFLSKVNVDSTFTKIVDKPRSISNFLKSFFHRKPMSVYRNYSSDFKSDLSKIIYNFDTVIVDHFLMFQYIPKDYKGKIILHQHNAEYIMWNRLSEITPNLIKKTVLAFESFRIKKYEREICEKSNVVLASPNDIESLSAITKNVHFEETYHLGDDKLLNYFHPGFSTVENKITYIGSLDWYANEDGLRWFIENVWQEILFQNPNATLDIVGKGASESFTSYCHKFEHINLLGFVESLEAQLDKTKILIAPLRFGSGMKVKTINSLYTGIPLVSTSVGAEGIMIEDKVHFCKADTAFDQIESITKLFSDKDYWEHIGGEARECSKENYTWKNNLNNLKEVIDECNQVCEHSIQSIEQRRAA